MHIVYICIANVYARMCVLMHACTYVCMHVCMYVGGRQPPSDRRDGLPLAHAAGPELFLVLRDFKDAVFTFLRTVLRFFEKFMARE